MKKYLKYLITLLLILIVSFWFYLDRDKGSPVENFKTFFKIFEENYALFEVKQIDWEKEYKYYSEKVNENTTDDELFNIFQEVLSKLNDKHCYIHRFNQIYFSGFGLSALIYWDLLSFEFRVPANDFSLELVEKKYLIESEKSLKIYSLLPPIGIRKVFTTGWLQDSIAYIHMTEMSKKSDEVHKSIITFLEKHQNANGFVIDIRDNIGGYSQPVKELAEYFTDKKHVYAISRLRKPNSIYSYQEPDYWEIKPKPESKFKNKSIALLINENTQSAAELFTLMMKTIPNVKVISDTTSGVFADTHIGKLPNGWEYRLSIRKTNDWNNCSFEGIGIVPDTLIINTKYNLENGNDHVIEYAIKYLQSNEKVKNLS